MRSKVSIHDHLTGRLHVTHFTRRNDGVGEIEHLVRLGFSSVFGSSAGPIEIHRNDDHGAEAYAKGMRVFIEHEHGVRP